MKRTDGLLTALLSASAFVATARLRKNPLQRARGRKANSKVRHQLFALAAIPLAASVYAVAGDFVGSEFRANTYRSDSQAEASVAWDHAGNAVVVC